MKAIMQSVLLAGLVVTCICLVGCGDDGAPDCCGPGDDTKFTAEEPYYSVIDVVDQTTLRVEGVSGTISVDGLADSDSIVVAATRRVRSGSVADAEAHLPLLQIEVQEGASEVIVRTQQPTETEGRSYEVDYEITVPADFDLVLDNVNGNITVSEMNSSLDIGNVNGTVVLDDIFGDVSVGLTNGQIEAEVTLPFDGTIDMGVTNGNILLGIPLETSAEFSAGVTNGKITVSGSLDLKDSHVTNVSVTGTLGDGDGDISLMVVNGNIDVTGF
jgi:DUF4097 and DUF4098 domain-containing protein YvlB